MNERRDADSYIIKAYNYIIKIGYAYKYTEAASYAAAASFYIFLSIIPIVALIIAFIPFTPLTQSDILDFMQRFMPTTLLYFTEDIISQLYNTSNTVISLSIIILFWSAAKGMQAITRGLNAANGVKETRPFIVLRLEAIMHTFFLIILIIFLFVVGFAGKIAYENIIRVIFTEFNIFHFLYRFRFLYEWIFVAVFFCPFYTWIPNNGKGKNPFKTWRGALFTGITWSLFSYLFNFYLTHFQSFSMYGSLATIIVVMIWIFVYVNLFFLGAFLDAYIRGTYKDAMVPRYIENVVPEGKLDNEKLLRVIEKRHAKARMKEEKKKLREEIKLAKKEHEKKKKDM